MEQGQLVKDEYEAILARATLEADLAMAVVSRLGADEVEARARAEAEPIGWRASWLDSMVRVRGGVRVVVTLDDGREVSLDRSRARMLGVLLLAQADELPRGSDDHEEHVEMVLGLMRRASEESRSSV